MVCTVRSASLHGGGGVSEVGIEMIRAKEEVNLSSGQTLGWLLVLLAWAWAAVVGNGFELQRQAVVVAVLLLGTGLCCASRDGIPIRAWWVWMVLIVASYFLVRGLTSPVWDLARRDMILVAGALLSICAGSIGLRSGRGRGMFLVALGGLLIANAGFGFFQKFHDPAFSVLRGPRADQLGVSGFYYHRNYLAGFLEFCLPVFGAWALTVRAKGWKVVGGILMAGGIVLAWATASRGGFAVCGLGLLTVVALWLGSIWGGLSGRAKSGAAGAVVVCTVALLVVWRIAFESLQIGRTGEELGMSDFQLRLRLSGIGFDIWQQNPLWGNGARSYSYEVINRYGGGGLPAWLGNPDMAHNDYIQALADYGLVGLILLGLLGVLMGLGAFRGVLSSSKDAGGWVKLTFVAALLAASLHAVVDFNLHILPNLMLLALLAGGSLGMLEPRKGRGNFIGVVAVLAVGGVVMGATIHELRTTPRWFRMEQLRGEERYREMRVLAAEAPEFHLMREIARDSNRRRLGASAPGQTGTLVAQCLVDWRAAYARHAHDPETISNLARALDWSGEFEEAEGYHRQALAAAGSRENKYGLKGAYAEHLRLWAGARWQSREPGAARYLYEQARAWSEASRTSGNHGLTRAQYLEMLKWLDSRIQYLEHAGISSEPDERILSVEQ